MFKVGDKFVLKINDIVKSGSKTLYKTNMHTLVGEEALDNIPKIIEGFEETSYNAGAQDAWEIAGLLGKLTVDELEEIFGHIGSHKIYDMPYGEVKAKIEFWKESKRKIKRGDIVKSKYGPYKGVVLTRSPNGECRVLWEDPAIDTHTYVDKLEKTNENFVKELDDLMELIR